MKTIKATLARERNWTKSRLLGALSLFKNAGVNVLTKEEATEARQIATLIEDMISNFDTNSKKLGLNIERYNIVDSVNNQIIYRSLTKKEAKIFLETHENVYKTRVV